MNILGAVVRFIVSALVIWFVSFFVPGFEVAGFWSALVAALVIALIGWGIEAMFGQNVSPFGRGVVGFLVSAAIIYATQFFVGGVDVTLIGAILAALAIGIVDMLIPTRGPLENRNRT